MPTDWYVLVLTDQTDAEATRLAFPTAADAVRGAEEVVAEAELDPDLVAVTVWPMAPGFPWGQPLPDNAPLYTWTRPREGPR